MSSVKLARVDLKYTILEGASLEGVEKKEIINESNVIPKGILDKVKTIDENEEDSIDYRYAKDDMYDEDSYG
jgi:hypothetical protein